MVENRLPVQPIIHDRPEIVDADAEDAIQPIVADAVVQPLAAQPDER